MNVFMRNQVWVQMPGMDADSKTDYKPVKKNTTYRRLRAWEKRLDHRQQQREIVPDTVDDTNRTCFNCGHHYAGRVCPQCGQIGTWGRYTWRQAFFNLLDIWGLGNRPMFRTLKELFWRPGYMIRDYLRGHRQFYFPPFKLLAVTLVLLLAISWLTGVEAYSLFRGADKDLSLNDNKFSGGLYYLVNAGIRLIHFLASNLLYEWLFIGVFLVIGIWIGFYRYRLYNFVETYIFLVFLIAQQILCEIPNMLGEGLSNFISAHTVNATGLTLVAASAYSAISGVISTVYSYATLLLSIVTFRQFYGLKWKTTIWRILISMAALIAIGFIVAIIIVIFTYDDVTKMERVHIMLALTLIPAAFILANWLFNKYKSSVESSIMITCKCLMLSVFMIPIESIKTDDNEYGILMSVVLVSLYGIALAAASLLPIFLYKKTQRTWLAISLSVAIVAFLISLPFWV